MDVLRELGMTVLTENEVSFWFFILETTKGRDENFMSLQVVFLNLFVLLLLFRRGNVCQLDPLSSI